MTNVTLNQSAALIVAAAASRIEEETKTLAKLTARLRGLALVEPAELARLRSVEKAAHEVCDCHAFDGAAPADLVNNLRDALAPDWVLEKLQLAEGGALDGS